MDDFLKGILMMMGACVLVLAAGSYFFGCRPPSHEVYKKQKEEVCGPQGCTVEQVKQLRRIADALEKQCSATKN